MSEKKILLYTLGTPNGFKISCALEELEIPYDIKIIDIRKNEQFTEEFIRVNPNSKIPAIVDPNGPDGKEICVFESGSILLYLAEKTGKLIPKDPVKRVETMNWLFWQMAGVGPMFGQFNHFANYAPEKIEYGIKRYRNEAKRLLGVLNKQLEGKQYVVGDEITIADFAIYPWIVALQQRFSSDEELEFNTFTNVLSWIDRLKDRPSIVKGMEVGKIQ